MQKATGRREWKGFDQSILLDVCTLMISCHQQEKLLEDTTGPPSGECIFQGPDAFLLIIPIIFFSVVWFVWFWVVVYFF